MKGIIVTIITMALVFGLIVGVILPLVNKTNEAGTKTQNSMDSIVTNIPTATP